jgi:hypothetical protein
MAGLRHLLAVGTTAAAVISGMLFGPRLSPGGFAISARKVST